MTPEQEGAGERMRLADELSILSDDWPASLVELDNRAAAQLRADDAEIISLRAQVGALRVERDALKQDAERYATIRCFTPPEYVRIWRANIFGKGTFDALVDEARTKENQRG